MRHRLMMTSGISRILRAPETDQGGGTSDSGATGDNAQGNNGSGDNGGGTQDNNGSGFNAAAFWNEPESKDGNGGTGATGDSAPAGTGDQSGTKTAGEQFAADLQGLKFGEVFTAEVAEQIAAGDMKGANANFQTQLIEATKNSVIMAARLMQQNNTALETRFQAMIDKALGGRDDDSTLLANFPAAKNPAIKPMIQGVYNQALKHTKGDRTAAVAMAKDMLKFMGSNAQSDLGIETPPGGPGDSQRHDGEQSLLDGLLTR